MNIAMWSGPRNLSTALMYAFAARGDCAVWDEPFYAAYLAATGAAHPMADRIVAHHEADPAIVAGLCAASAAEGHAHMYQKHMAQHMLPQFDGAWFGEVRHAFLIRHPARVLASYDAKRERPDLADIGAEALAGLYDRAAKAAGAPPPVLDSAQIRAAPEPALRALCAALGLPFTDRMLRWPAGGHAADGVWAAHWYGAVHRSTGFAGPEAELPPVAPHLRAVHDAALPHYEALRAKALRI